MLLDQFMPAYEFHELHSVMIKATAEKVFKAMKELTATELSPLVFLLMAIRGLPARLLRRQAEEKPPAGPFLEQMYRGGFIPLEEAPDKEIVFGLIGQFWKAAGGVAPDIHEAQEFLSFDDRAFAKVAANLYIQEVNGSVRCSTETRIHVPGPSARRKFALYWWVISMGSALIRLMWLRAIKRKAERQLN